ncbi:MAG: thioredoxin family protein [Kiritimatiellae bacterium]|nr:thioredoxin family protein [Kiritimatiellia bacterium]
MKKILLIISAIAISIAVEAASSTPNGFTDDLGAAISSSKKSGKSVFAVFSGSDWCYWCKVLEQGYLSKKEFVNEASKKFELVYIDMPRDKSLLSEKAQKNNPLLLKKYAIRGFPTVMFIKHDGSGIAAPRPAKDISPEEYAKVLAKEVEKFSREPKSK